MSYMWNHMDHSNILTWVLCQSGYPLPKSAICAGLDKDGHKLYVGRSIHQGDMLPAKINPSHSVAYVCWGGLEHAKKDYEVLCNANIAWQTVLENHIPRNAVVVGKTVNHENLYMGRALYDGTLTPGKVQHSHKCLYIPYNGKEITVKEYEIMISL